MVDVAMLTGTIVAASQKSEHGRSDGWVELITEVGERYRIPALIIPGAEEAFLKAIKENKQARVRVTIEVVE